MGYLTTLFRYYFSRRVLPYWAILLIDCVVMLASALLVYVLNNGAVYSINHFWPLCGTLAVYLTFYIVGFRLFKTYSGIIRYSSFVDLQRVADAVLVGLGLSVLCRWAFDFNELLMPIRFRDMLLWTIVGMLVMWLIRVMVKWFYDTLYHNGSVERVFIYGIKQGGISLAKSIRNQENIKWRVVGFVADEPEMKNRFLMGVHVYANDSNLAQVMKAQNAKVLFVSPLLSASLRDNHVMTDLLIEEGIRIFVVPTEYEWDGHSDLSPAFLREVEIEDLLPRDKIEIDMGRIGSMLAGSRVMITGAAGSIGSEIVRQVAGYGVSELVLLDQAETPLHDIRLMMRRDFPDVCAYTIVADIADKRRMEALFSCHKPDYVFHAAAYKHVPMMEDNPAESIHNNVLGTRIVADLAVKYRARKFVMVSTDKAVNPTNVMGCSKRICEIYVQSLDKAIREGQIEGITQFITTRFGNVLGSNGSVIPLFKEQIKRGGPLTVTHPEIIRYFMLIPEACKLVLEAGTMGNGGEIYVFDMGNPVRIVDLARRMIKLCGARDIEIVFTGLRDGEKLYEEVLNEKETTLPTHHPKILRAKVREYDYSQVAGSIDCLIHAAQYATSMEIVGQMKSIVPECKSQHSVYEQLDKPESQEISAIASRESSLALG